MHSVVRWTITKRKKNIQTSDHEVSYKFCLNYGTLYHINKKNQLIFIIDILADLICNRQTNGFILQLYDNN